MTKYKVVGQCEVAGTLPGGTVTGEVLEKAGANIRALVEAGHLEPVDVPKPAPGPKAKDGS